MAGDQQASAARIWREAAEISDVAQRQRGCVDDAGADTRACLGCLDETGQAIRRQLRAARDRSDRALDVEVIKVDRGQ